MADSYQQQEEDVWLLYCDGASRGNPGLAGAGVVLLDPDGEVRVQEHAYLGQTTNNVAEYRALLLGLQQAWKLGIRKLRVHSDSELLVRQLNGVYRVKQPHLQVLWREARQELQRFESCEVVHVPRELNRQADRLANQGIDQRPRSR